MFIGLTGPLGAGKGEVGEWFKRLGYGYLSLSDILRQECDKRGLERTRENLDMLGRELREKNGNGVLAKRVVAIITENNLTDLVIDSIRHPEEVAVLRSLPDFHLVAVNAPLRVRFERVRARARENDPKTFEEFVIKDKEHLGSRNKSSQQIAKTMALADVLVVNNGSLAELHSKLARMIADLKIRKSRPSWDEYFLKLAMVVAERSTCRRHNVGAVAVRGKKVLTTGYNGAAAGMKDCLELGCLRDQLGIPSGTRHEICRAIHAEQNVIIQAAQHGISLEGATVYCTHTPCILCAKMLANAKIKEFVTYGCYADKQAIEFLKDAGIKLRILPMPNTKINIKP